MVGNTVARGRASAPGVQPSNDGYRDITLRRLSSPTASAHRRASQSPLRKA